MANGINAPYGVNAYQNLSGNADITKIQTFPIAADYIGHDGVIIKTPSIFAGDPVVMAQWDAARAGSAGVVGTIGTIIPLSALSAAAAATAQIVGYFLSVDYITPNNIYSYEFPFWLAGTLVSANPSAQYPISAKVNIDPHVMMQVQVSTSGKKLSDTVFLNSWLNYSGALSTAVDAIVNDIEGPGAKQIPAGYKTTQNPAINSNTNIGNSIFYLDGSTLTTAIASNAKVATGNFKVMGVVYPTSVFNVGNQSVANAAIINELVVGSNMPFVNVYGKFNNHMYAAGTANPSVIAP